MKTVATTIKGSRQFVNEKFKELTENKFKGEFPTQTRKQGTAFRTNDNVHYRWYFHIDGRYTDFVSVSEY